jgi:hypothetical protein
VNDIIGQRCVWTAVDSSGPTTHRHRPIRKMSDAKRGSTATPTA